VTDTGAPTPWWEHAHAASFRPGPAPQGPPLPGPALPRPARQDPGLPGRARQDPGLPGRARQDPGFPDPGLPGSVRPGSARPGPIQQGSALPAAPRSYPAPVAEQPLAVTGSLSLGLGRGSRERELIRQVAAPLPGTRRVVMLSIKGGVGKTTNVAVTGSLLAGLRRDKVVALDASSDWGTLATRLSVVPRHSVRELAANGRHAVSEHGVLAQLAAAPSGLLVVGSDPQTVISGALTEEEYVQTLRLLEYVGTLILADVGAGLQQSFLPAALAGCDQLVVASAATWDAAQSAGAALDWLAARGFGPLVERSVVVMNNLYPVRRRRSSYVRDLKSDLSRRARAVHEVPFDAALQPGGRILLRKLSASVRQAYLELAADIVAGLSHPR
jgi:MinD-like ATPase involved in chromosome partitioning or flagellar assembly